MSMNLHAIGVDLWQTPTWITYLALFDSNGDERSLEEALHIYISWVETHTEGVWNSAEDHESMRERVRNHIEEVKTDVKKLYMM